MNHEDLKIKVLYIRIQVLISPARYTDHYVIVFVEFHFVISGGFFMGQLP